MGEAPSRRRARSLVPYAAPTFCLGPQLRALRDRGRRVEAAASVIGCVLVAPMGSTGVEVRLWDAPGLTRWEGFKQPIWVVYTEKERSWTERKGATVWECQALRILEVATTLSPAEASARVVWEMARGRWGVENEGFRQLKHEWHLEHGFLHHPAGMPVRWAFRAAAYP